MNGHSFKKLIADSRPSDVAYWKGTVEARINQALDEHRPKIGDPDRYLILEPKMGARLFAKIVNHIDKAHRPYDDLEEATPLTRAMWALGVSLITPAAHPIEIELPALREKFDFKTFNAFAKENRMTNKAIGAAVGAQETTIWAIRKGRYGSGRKTKITDRLDKWMDEYTTPALEATIKPPPTRNQLREDQHERIAVILEKLAAMVRKEKHLKLTLTITKEEK